VVQFIYTKFKKSAILKPSGYRQIFITFRLVAAYGIETGTLRIRSQYTNN